MAYLKPRLCTWEAGFYQAALRSDSSYSNQLDADLFRSSLLREPRRATASDAPGRAGGAIDRWASRRGSVEPDASAAMVPPRSPRRGSMPF